MTHGTQESFIIRIIPVTTENLASLGGTVKGSPARCIALGAARAAWRWLACMRRTRCHPILMPCYGRFNRNRYYALGTPSPIAGPSPAFAGAWLRPRRCSTFEGRRRTGANHHSPLLTGRMASQTRCFAFGVPVARAASHTASKTRVRPGLWRSQVPGTVTKSWGKFFCTKGIAFRKPQHRMNRALVSGFGVSPVIRRTNSGIS